MNSEVIVTVNEDFATHEIVIRLQKDVNGDRISLERRASYFDWMDNRESLCRIFYNEFDRQIEESREVNLTP